MLNSMNIILAVVLLCGYMFLQNIFQELLNINQAKLYFQRVLKWRYHPFFFKLVGFSMNQLFWVSKFQAF